MKKLQDFTDKELCDELKARKFVRKAEKESKDLCNYFNTSK